MDGWMDWWTEGWMDDQWLDVWMEGWMEEWKDDWWMDVWIIVCMYGFINGWMNGWMFWWIYVHTDSWMYRHYGWITMDGWMDLFTDILMDWRMNGWMYKWMNNCICTDVWIERWMDRWMYAWMMDGWDVCMDRQTDMNVKVWWRRCGDCVVCQSVSRCSTVHISSTSGSLSGLSVTDYTIFFTFVTPLEKNTLCKATDGPLQAWNPPLPRQEIISVSALFAPLLSLSARCHTLFSPPRALSLFLLLFFIPSRPFPPHTSL